MVHGLSCSAACRIFPDQGLNLYLLHWQEGFFFFFFFTEPPREPYSFVFIHFLPSLFADLCQIPRLIVILISGFIILLPCKSRPLLI